MYDYVIEKPSLDDALIHYGIRGMRWGHRKQVQRQVRVARPRRQHRGYSQKSYEKYRQTGMTHNEAVTAAKNKRKKVIAGIIAGAAIAGATAYGVHSVKSKNQVNYWENKSKKAEAKRQKKMNNFKFRSLNEYNAAKDSLTKKAEQDYKAGKRNKVEITDGELRRYGYRTRELTKLTKKAANPLISETSATGRKRRAKKNKAIQEYNKLYGV